VAQHRRLRADITSVAAPGRPADLPEGNISSGRQYSEGLIGSHFEATVIKIGEGLFDDSSRAVSSAEQGNPRLTLRTQLQQLSELSELMGQRLCIGEDQHPKAQSGLDRDVAVADNSLKDSETSMNRHSGPESGFGSVAPGKEEHHGHNDTAGEECCVSSGLQVEPGRPANTGAVHSLLPIV